VCISFNIDEHDEDKCIQVFDQLISFGIFFYQEIFCTEEDSHWFDKEKLKKVGFGKRVA